MSYAVGSLVKARGREWVVLPESEEDLLMIRPLGGTEDEVTGIFLPLETVEPATFALPDTTQIGDYRSCLGEQGCPAHVRVRDNQDIPL